MSFSCPIRHLTIRILLRPYFRGALHKLTTFMFLRIHYSPLWNDKSTNNPKSLFTKQLDPDHSCWRPTKDPHPPPRSTNISWVLVIGQSCHRQLLGCSFPFVFSLFAVFCLPVNPTPSLAPAPRHTQTEHAPARIHLSPFIDPVPHHLGAFIGSRVSISNLIFNSRTCPTVLVLLLVFTRGRGCRFYFHLTEEGKRTDKHGSAWCIFHDFNTRFAMKSAREKHPKTSEHFWSVKHYFGCCKKISGKEHRKEFRILLQN